MSIWSTAAAFLLGFAMGPAAAAPSSGADDVMPSERQAWLQSAERRLQELGVASIRYDDRVIERNDIPKSNLPVAVAWTLAALPEHPESDVSYESRRLVPVAYAGQQPVQVRVDDGQATIRHGEDAVELVTSSSAGRIKRMWQLGALEAEPGARWSPEALTALHTALRQLTSSELEATTDVARIIRSPMDPRPDDHAAGRYIRDEDAPRGRIELYDAAFTGSEGTFVGSVVSPMPTATTTVLQQLGHAFADHPARVLEARHQETVALVEAELPALRSAGEALDGLLARDEATATGRKKLGDGAQRRALSEVLQAKDAFKRQAEVHAELMGAMDRQAELFAEMEGPGPVARAYASIPEALDGPAADGPASPENSFAEAFAWWHVDPEGYARACPVGAAWFEGGGHVAALQRALDAIDMVSR